MDTIRLLYQEKEYHMEKGQTMNEVSKLITRDEIIYAGILNGKLHDLNYRIHEGGHISFVDAKDETGKLIYERSLSFLFIVAVKSLFQNASVFLEHALSNGQYCDILLDVCITLKDVSRIEEKMKEIIKRKENFHREVLSTVEAIAYFENIGMMSKANLLCNRKSDTSSIYRLCGYEDYFYGIMLPDTSYITHFSLRSYPPGVWLSPYDNMSKQTKLFQVFQEYENWGKLIGISNVAQLNQQIKEGNMDEIILMSETKLEIKLGELAQDIIEQHEQTKFILISGPSSAGKTTFSNRLSIHLKIRGRKPFPISIDNFYRNRESCPKLPDGNYDFEGLEALDVPLFHDTMYKLLQRMPVCLPIFNFKTGLREWSKEEIVIGEDEIIIIEGIHALNPQMTKYLPEDALYKIYINALTHLNLDEHNRIPTSDYRLIRRIVRDYRTRNWSAKATIGFWKNVKASEDKYIYPYQEAANYIYNTSMIYELAILKKIAIPLLEEVKHTEAEYLEANRLHKFLDYFVDGDASAVPRNSILAEFIGNSVFDVN